MNKWLANFAIGIDLGIRHALLRAQLARAVRDPMRSQRAVLAQILHANRDSRIGRQYDFAAIEDERAYRERVPVHDYEALRPYVEAEIASAEQALSCEAPMYYLRTSGSTGRPKDIPLTHTHLKRLRRIQHQSVALQHHRHPLAFNGSILAIAGTAVEGHLANGRPFGAASAVVSGSSPALLRDKFVLPAAISAISDVRLKYLLIVRLAIARRNLSYLGTANPGTLLALMAVYRDNEAALIDDLRHGGFFAHGRVPAQVLRALGPHLAADPARADELEQLRSQAARDRAVHEQAPHGLSLCDLSPSEQNNGAGTGLRIADLWPDLRLVVTWTCASAGIALAALRAELPAGTRIHELGYLSSEFMGTITIGARSGSGLLTHDTHFFEFVEREQWERGEAQFLVLDQLRKGCDYYVLVTTPSGLYRYFINDLIRVTAIIHRMPLVKFLQKGKGVTNIIGEKLYESQLLEAVAQAMVELGLVARFVMALADEAACRYCLYVECAAVAQPLSGVSRPARDAQRLALQVDKHLQVLNLEYRAKRESGRLQAMSAFWLRADTEIAFRQACVAQGQREGQFKSIALAYRSESFFDLDARVEPPTASMTDST